MNPEDGGFAVKNYIENPVQKDGDKCDGSNISDNDSGCAIESRNVSPQIESVEDDNAASTIDLDEEEESRYSSIKSKDKIGIILAQRNCNSSVNHCRLTLWSQ